MVPLASFGVFLWMYNSKVTLHVFFILFMHNKVLSQYYLRNMKKTHVDVVDKHFRLR